MPDIEEGRAKTMARIALRRLSATELVGLGIGLAAIEEAETDLIETLESMRLAAQKELRVRELRELPGLGPYGHAFMVTKRLAARLGLAREDTEVAMETGKVERVQRG